MTPIPMIGKPQVRGQPTSQPDNRHHPHNPQQQTADLMANTYTLIIIELCLLTPVLAWVLVCAIKQVRKMREQGDPDRAAGYPEGSPEAEELGETPD